MLRKYLLHEQMNTIQSLFWQWDTVGTTIQCPEAASSIRADGVGDTKCALRGLVVVWWFSLGVNLNLAKGCPNCYENIPGCVCEGVSSESQTEIQRGIGRKHKVLKENVGHLKTIM